MALSASCFSSAALLQRRVEHLLLDLRVLRQLLDDLLHQLLLLALRLLAGPFEPLEQGVSRIRPKTFCRKTNVVPGPVGASGTFLTNAPGSILEALCAGSRKKLKTSSTGRRISIDVSIFAVSVSFAAGRPQAWYGRRMAEVEGGLPGVPHCGAPHRLGRAGQTTDTANTTARAPRTPAADHLASSRDRVGGDDDGG
jgi:hypothetical protein